MIQDLAPDTATTLQEVAERVGASPERILVILAVAVGLHLLVRLMRRASEWIVTPDRSPELARDLFQKRQPRTATVTTLIVSALTFAIYYFAFGFVVEELGLFDPRVYFASATVIGLAVGFGSQGLVQDVVIGVTLIFSDAFNVGDVVEISGQIGRVEKVGLRFTTLINFVGQTVYIPNRNIGLIARYRRGVVRAFVDVQVPAAVDEQELVETVRNVVRGMRVQQPAIFLSEPELLGPFAADPGGWRFLRVKLRIWPGQNAFVENAFRQRLLAAVRRLDPDYSDWMLSISYRVVS